MSWGRLTGEKPFEGEVDYRAREHPPGMRFFGLNALVTGAGTGFGGLICLALAREGANVVVSYNSSREGAEKISSEIRAMSRKSIAYKIDITKWDDVKKAADDLWKSFGPIDVLVNNAGDMASKQMSWRQITEEWIDQTLAIDLKGPIYMMHEFGQRMIERKTGSIVNIASHVIVLGSPRAPQYAAAKSGLIGLTKSYALAFGPWVRVNAACPGYIETELMKKRADWTPERRKWILEHTPLKRIAKPADIVPTILFLASEDSNHMTGNIIVCDGGHTMPAA
ncbi:MAG: SDR family NAD(P)-dependent oxidoreductase [Nitrososphaerales archaeon]